MNMKFNDFIKEIKNNHKGKLYIQPHDYPDYDAICSAFGLQKFLEHYSIFSTIIYGGMLSNFIEDELLSKLDIISKKINLEKTYKYPIFSVDTIPSNSNITNVKGDYIGFLDHHINNKVEGKFRYEYMYKSGAVSSLIIDIFIDNSVEIDRNTANALSIGLLTDTNSLTRGVEDRDLKNYMSIFNKINFDFVNYIVRNKLSVKNLQSYYKAINSFKLFGDIGLVFVDNPSDKNILGIIGDFFLSLKEVSVNILAARTERGTLLSVRSEDENLKANETVNYILKGIGSGGGHVYMAGGFTEKLLDKNFIIKKIKGLNNE